MLVCNSFRCHLTDNVNAQRQKRNTVMAVIPGGCTKFRCVISKKESLILLKEAKLNHPAMPCSSNG